MKTAIKIAALLVALPAYAFVRGGGGGSTGVSLTAGTLPTCDASMLGQFKSATTTDVTRICVCATDTNAATYFWMSTTGQVGTTTTCPSPQVTAPPNYRTTKVKRWSNGSGTTVFALGGPAAGTTGTLSNVASGGSDWINAVTATTLNATGGFNVTSVANWASLKKFSTVIRTGPNAQDIATDARILVYLSTARVSSSDSPTGNHFVGFRLSGVVPDTNWQFLTCDTVSCNVVDTGVAGAVNTTYTLEFVWNAGVSATAFINGTKVAYSTGNITTNTTVLNAYAEIIHTNGSNGTGHNIRWMSTAIEE